MTQKASDEELAQIKALIDNLDAVIQDSGFSDSVVAIALLEKAVAVVLCVSAGQSVYEGRHPDAAFKDNSKGLISGLMDAIQRGMTRYPSVLSAVQKHALKDEVIH
jgi:GMP synthase PP-ATPase subunit